jgi:hypothetical protein
MLAESPHHGFNINIIQQNGWKAHKQPFFDCL